jgi:murein DD-endopeptidase MepM/ murein hydrolase activator NlpD
VGGKVVWLQPLFGNMRLYYAHLDTQLVERGQFVLAGEPVGTVGNTGNAITTPPHLHFGVYVRQPGMRGGAQDPYRFLH